MLSEALLTLLLTTGATTATSAPAQVEIAEGKENGQVELTVQSGARANVLRLQSEVAVPQTEIRVEMTADHENRRELDLAAGRRARRRSGVECWSCLVNRALHKCVSHPVSRGTSEEAGSESASLFRTLTIPSRLSN
jgi:hypothetical protein